ncbi:MAG: aspartate/glutamate racemase family protein [Deltaproteobacteria bacterium]|jgi:maleate isomerase|nr:aspartate/glutamate racemase family protein [Deltaproteobacteria bacterium]MDO8956766.1 aspartate/glutamate racemase family protein [Deltaproteobacteria bacterium]MDO9211829.1 aspartate/glutamate racemase family protein [Deltaproteobacteria bacterium]MDP3040884.1 aspartate/glutamate racemase family protein [Deltaproteobacteria bacterium]
MEKTFRVGLLVPSSNTIMEVDLYRSLSAPITIHPARMYLEETTPEGERRMLSEEVPRAANLLKTLHPHLVVFGCTSAGALSGSNFPQEINRQIGTIVGCPVLDILTPVAEELKRIQAKKLAVLTPYSTELNQSIRISLEGMGFQVLSIEGMGITVNFELATPGPEEIVAFALKSSISANAEALFLSCTNFRAWEAMPLLQRHFRMPIVTSNQATIEKIKRVYARAA